MPISKPANGKRNDSRAKPRGGVFLGGPLSAMLLSLCFFEGSGILERTIPWFGLLPLLISLGRHRYSLKWRLLHGFFFGSILCCWPLASAGSWVEAPILSTAEASLPIIGAWMLFCAAGGVLLRKSSPLAIVPAMAVTWTAIEYLRVEYIPLANPGMQLGQLLQPDSPEGQIATVIGLSGLGFVICLVNGAFFLALRESRARTQVFPALAATLGVLGMVGLGSIIEAPGKNGGRLPGESLRVGLVQNTGDGSGKHLDLARQLLNSKPRLILFPSDTFPGSGDKPGFKTGLETFAREEGVAIGAGVLKDRESGGDSRPSLLYIASGARHGDESAEEILSIETKEGQSILLVTDRVSHSAHQMRRLASEGAQLFLVAGDSAGMQTEMHRLLDRLLAFRALETGAGICRATRKGSSSILNNRGSLQAEAPKGQDWAAVNPAPLLDPRQGHTWFVKGGWVLAPGCLFALGILALLELYSRRKIPGAQDSTRPS